MNDPILQIFNKDTGTGSPSQGWIQWKGTSVCMDVRCECGELTHIDAEFAYFIECGKCHRKFLVGAHVTLHPLTDVEAEIVKTKSHGFIITE